MKTTEEHQWCYGVVPPFFLFYFKVNQSLAVARPDPTFWLWLFSACPFFNNPTHFDLTYSG